MYTMFIVLTTSTIPFTTFTRRRLGRSRCRGILSKCSLSTFSRLSNSDLTLLGSLSLLSFSCGGLLSFSTSSIFTMFGGVIASSVGTPLGNYTTIVIVVVLSTLFRNFGRAIRDNRVTDTISAIDTVTISLVLISGVGFAISTKYTTVRIYTGFVCTFFPTFYVVITTSKDAITTFSAGALLLSVTRVLGFVSRGVFVPLSGYFLTLNVYSNVEGRLGLNTLISGLGGCLVATVSIYSNMFVSILSVGATITSETSTVKLHSVHFTVGSIIPIVKDTIDRNLLSVRTCSSLVHDDINITNVTTITILFLPPVLRIVF